MVKEGAVVSNEFEGFDVLGLAETFLQRNEEVSVAGYVWYGRNRGGGRRVSGGSIGEYELGVEGE